MDYSRVPLQSKRESIAHEKSRSCGHCHCDDQFSRHHDVRSRPVLPSSAEKKLAGAAKTSFLKKCEHDAMAAATTACEAQAADKKLAGAAKTSFVKKCVKDSMAPAK